MDASNLPRLLQVPFDNLLLLFNDRGDGVTFWTWLLQAWGVSLGLSVIGFVVALILGSLMGTLRTVPNRGLAFLGNAWTEIFRNVPLILQVFIWYYVLPSFFPSLIDFPSFILVVFALGFFTSARIAEQVKAGIESLPKGQRYAGLAMGLTLTQTYRYVLLPMAFRIVIPPFTSESMNIIKNSSVAFAVTVWGSVGELTFFAQQAGNDLSRELMIYGIVTICYFVSSFTVNRIMAVIEKAVRVPGLQVGGSK